jgi:GNAT superfamily N-acetyltransferase
MEGCGYGYDATKKKSNSLKKKRMGQLPKSFGAIRIVSLTQELAQRFHDASRKELSGDGSCSLPNMDDSCFASESCNRGFNPTMTVNDLLFATHAFVAMEDDVFVGCVSASDSSHLCHKFKNCQNTPGLLLSNLCVNKKYRRSGVGKELIQHIVDRSHPATYLTVAGENPNASEDVRKTFRSRVERLFKTYNNLHFDFVDKDDTSYLFRYVPR